MQLADLIALAAAGESQTLELKKSTAEKDRACRAPANAQRTHSAPVSSEEQRTLSRLLSAEPHLEFAVLIGSRATGTAHATSDWDIALHWAPQPDWLTLLGDTETLRRKLAAALNIPEHAIDLIELRRANLAMRASVAEEGLPLMGADTLAWAHFLKRTWREIEDFYWDKAHAA